MKRVLVCIALFILPASAWSADAETPKTVDRMTLSAGDTVVFLGDSITHQCLYTQYVEDYFYTRYPDLNIRFHNAGVSGDKAADALARFARDVAKYKAKYVTILLGMNDGQYTHFNHEIFKRYETDMTEILDRIRASGAIAIAMGPTSFDSRSLNPKVARWIKDRDLSRAYYNAKLAFYGTWLREQAMNRGVGYVDMFEPLNRHTYAARAAKPNFTLVPDAVHPQGSGHAIMAFTLLEQMQANRQVSAVTAQQRKGQWKVAAGKTGTVSDIAGDGESLSFTFTAKALPWVLPEDAAEGYKLCKAGHKMSNERLRVAGLKPGRYDLKIDGVLVGTYPHMALGAKLELQSNAKTPQYQQALKVALLNKERNEKAVKPLRNLWGRTKGTRRRYAEKQPEKLAAWLEQLEGEIAKVETLADDYEKKIKAAAKPVARRYEILPHQE
jgi:lysophospholipase L1-like esterase